MKEFRSQCIVCCTEFPVSQTPTSNSLRTFKYNFRVFCAYLNIPIAWNWTRNEKNEIYLWDSACGSFSFCFECKASVDTLYNIHKKKLSKQKSNEIHEIVSTLVNKILAAESGVDDKTIIKNEGENSKLFEIIAERIRERIKDVQQTIWDYFNPKVILTDCKKELNVSTSGLCLEEEYCNSSADSVECALDTESKNDKPELLDIALVEDVKEVNLSQDCQAKVPVLNEKPFDMTNSATRVSKRKRKPKSCPTDENNVSEKDDDDDEQAPKKKNVRHNRFKIVKAERGILQYGPWIIEEIIKGKKYKCQKCGQTTTRVSTLVRHINSAHILKTGGYSRVVVDDNGIYHLKEWKFEKLETGFKCLECGRIRRHRHSMVNHIKEVHNTTDRLKCDACGKSWSTAEGLASHKCCPKVTTRELKNVDLGGGKFVYNGMWAYDKIDSDEFKGFRCGACGATKTTVDRMSAHIRERHIDPSKYVCDVCGFTAGNQSVMRQHKTCHSDVRDKACDVCGKCFKTLSRLGAHKVGHRSERFHCGVCNKSFQYQNGLGRHRRLTGHTDPATPQLVSYDCSKCERNLRTQKRLNSHLPRCNGVKAPPVPPVVTPYVCTTCGEIIMDEDLLLHHMASVHSITYGTIVGQEDNMGPTEHVIVTDGDFQLVGNETTDYIILLDDEGPDGNQDVQNTVQIWMDALGSQNNFIS